MSAWLKKTFNPALLLTKKPPSLAFILAKELPSPAYLLTKRLPRFKFTFRKIPNIFSIKMPTLDWVFWYCFAVFLVALFPLFFWVVEPSVRGENHLRIGADSSMYIWYAGMETDTALLGRSYYIDGPRFTGDLNLATLVTFGGNLLGPVLIATTLKSNFLFMLLNYLLFFIALHYVWKQEVIRKKLFIFLLFLNPITAVSLLTLNKEIFVLLSVAMLAHYLGMKNRSWLFLLMIVLVSTMARWEQSLFVVAFLLLLHPVNLLRKRRLIVTALIIAAITVIYPLIAAGVNPVLLAGNGDGGNLLPALNRLQDHFLFFAVLFPKMLLNFAGTLLNFRGYGSLDWHDVQNSLIILWAGASMLLVSAAILFTGRLRLRRDLIYFAVLFVIICCASPFVQLRYMYGVYVIACMELATVADPTLDNGITGPVGNADEMQ